MYGKEASNRKQEIDRQHYARGFADHRLRHIENPHDDVPSVGHEDGSDGCFHNPSKDERYIRIVHVVPVDELLNQLHAGYGEKEG